GSGHCTCLHSSHCALNEIHSKNAEYSASMTAWVMSSLSGCARSIHDKILLSSGRVSSTRFCATRHAYVSHGVARTYCFSSMPLKWHWLHELGLSSRNNGSIRSSYRRRPSPGTHWAGSSGVSGVSDLEQAAESSRNVAA